MPVTGSITVMLKSSSTLIGRLSWNASEGYPALDALREARIYAHRVDPSDIVIELMQRALGQLGGNDDMEFYCILIAHG